MAYSPSFTATGITGAGLPSRHVGATPGGAPTSGQFEVGDFVIDRSGDLWVCTAAGIPGTWASAGGSGVLTTEGDLLYENATPAPARLPIGSAAGSTGDFLGVSGGLPAWQQVSGQYLVTPASYAPASQTISGVTSTTMTAFSSASINTGSFTGPASGSVLVTVTCMIQMSVSSTGFAVGLLDHGLSTVRGNVVVTEDNSATFHRSYSFQFLVTGLTGGSSYNFDLAGCATSGDTVSTVAIGQSTTTPTLTSGSHGQPVIMTVQAV